MLGKRRGDAIDLASTLVDNAQGEDAYEHGVNKKQRMGERFMQLDEIFELQ